jgi:hypothetical protein
LGFGYKIKEFFRSITGLGSVLKFQISSEIEGSNLKNFKFYKDFVEKFHKKNAIKIKKVSFDAECSEI